MKAVANNMGVLKRIEPPHIEIRSDVIRITEGTEIEGLGVVSPDVASRNIITDIGSTVIRPDGEGGDPISSFAAIGRAFPVGPAQQLAGHEEIRRLDEAHPHSGRQRWSCQDSPFAAR